MIKYVALWKLAEGASEEEFEAVYRRHASAVADRTPGLLIYRISKVIPVDSMDNSYYRLAELYFRDVDAFREGMEYLSSLPEENEANPASCRRYMSSMCRLICDEETILG